MRRLALAIPLLVAVIGCGESRKTEAEFTSGAEERAHLSSLSNPTREQ